jgi:N6-adenosine-specific RNA methylase IME4
VSRFRVVLADPPWQFDNRGNCCSPDHAKVYTSSPLAPILGLGSFVKDSAEEDSLLFLWCPNALVLEGAATAVCRAWGFEPKQLIPWLKTCGDGETPRIGGGNYTRVCTEMLVLATHGRAAPLVGDRGVPGVILAPRGAHSAKPDESYQLIERLVPEGDCLELFGRRKYSTRWTVVGDEAPDEENCFRTKLF